MAFHSVKVPRLTDEVTTDPNWDRVITVPWKQIMTMHVGDGLELVSEDGVWIGDIEDIGDVEHGFNYIVVDLM